MSELSIQRRVAKERLGKALNAYLKIEAKSSAVIAIDMHRGHLDPEVATEALPVEHASKVVSTSAGFFEEIRKRQIPIIHVVLIYRARPEPALERASTPFKIAIDRAKQELLGLPSTLRTHNVEGSVQTQIIASLYNEAYDHVINCKKRLSAFYGTDLEILLRCLKRDTLLICGVNTNTCVLCSAFEAANRDFKTIVIADCCSSLYGDELHDFALDNISGCLGWVLSANEVIEKIDSREGNI
jgi:nicotinamidase-related amidase